jgi:hypothetical protein
MTKIRHVVVLAVGLAVASAGLAMASQQRPHRLSDQQLKDLVNRIDAHKGAFHAGAERAIDRSPINGGPAEEEMDRSVKSFEQATDLLRDRVSDRQSETADAANVLRRASIIDSLMMRHQLDTRSSSW